MLYVRSSYRRASTDCSIMAYRCFDDVVVHREWRQEIELGFKRVGRRVNFTSFAQPSRGSCLVVSFARYDATIADEK
jgi:hypothetical protein